MGAGGSCEFGVSEEFPITVSMEVLSTEGAVGRPGAVFSEVKVGGASVLGK